ncbi:MAG: hypothetical protein HPPSJP_5170 [Candidatus Hepatoplasma scabrum]|nr:MAG: hypothetical protein HPPSJP_5170 [Candidatus Hepatoplasma sp.]
MQGQISINKKENYFLKNFVDKLEVFNKKINVTFKLIEDCFFFDGLLRKEIILNINKNMQNEFINLKEWGKNNFLKINLKKWIKISVIKVNDYFDLIELKINQVLKLIGDKILNSNYLDRPYPYRKNSKIWRYDLISTEVFNILNDYDFYTKIHSEEFNYYLQELKLLKEDLLILIEDIEKTNIIENKEIKAQIYNLIFKE